MEVFHIKVIFTVSINKLFSKCELDDSCAQGFNVRAAAKWSPAVKDDN